MRNVQNVTSVKADDFPGLVAFVKEHEVNLVVPGPEAPLVAGIEGYFRAGAACIALSKIYALLSPDNSRDTMFRAHQSCCTYGRLKSVFQGFYDQASHTNGGL